MCVSAGWMGAIAVFLALTVIGMTSGDAATVRGVYLVMEPAARHMLVPLAIAGLVTGIIQSLGTPWGLLRHYWFIFRLVINLAATGVLLAYIALLSILPLPLPTPQPIWPQSATARLACTR